jgi:hypothetical protein
VSWLDGGQVLVKGAVQDDNPASAVIHLTGVVQADVHPDASGQYAIQLAATGNGTINVQAQDPNGSASGSLAMPPVTFQAGGTAGTGPQQGLQITGVEVTNENGRWVIRGAVPNAPPGTVIVIGSTNPDLNGRTVTVENPDGGFEIGYYPASGSLGGTISITARDVNGQTSDTIIRSID